MSEPKSSDTNSLSLSDSGTSPFAIRIASPSTTAVFPVPASPISIGLFLVLRESICIKRIISASRPITGSILSALAKSVKLRVNLTIALLRFSDISSPVMLSALSSWRICIVCSFWILNLFKMSFICPPVSNRHKNICSGPINSSLRDSDILEHNSNAFARSGVMYI